MEKSVPVLTDFSTTSPKNNSDGHLVLDGFQHKISGEDNNHVREKNLAVYVQNLYKSYKAGEPILSNLTMNVEKGTIYCLLGASGCGKSTLMSAMVGLTSCESGDVFICGRRAVPGKGVRNVGFMPQDNGLYDHLSIWETLSYFSELYGMRKKDAEFQIRKIVEVLKLPSEFNLIGNFSGGMRRRCSLAVALIYCPAVIILDEPTVGLDPLVRDGIWQYFRSIVKSQEQTIILSTHFIEEARQSDMLGIMRNGRIISEESPYRLALQNPGQLLADIVLNLCRKDEQVAFNSGNPDLKSKNVIEICNPRNQRDKTELYHQTDNFRNGLLCVKTQDIKDEYTHRSTTVSRYRALLYVIWLSLKRNPIFLTFLLFLPLIQMIATLAVLGSNPKGMALGIVNHEVSGLDDCSSETDKAVQTSTIVSGNFNETNDRCEFRSLSCRFIQELNLSGQITLVSIKSEEEGYFRVLAGDIWGYLSIPKNYSNNFEAFVELQKFADNNTLDGIRMGLRLDMSHYLMYRMIISTCYEAFAHFLSKLASRCGVDPREYSTPLVYRKPVFNKESPIATYLDYEIPIQLVIAMLALPTAMTAVLYMGDRKQGTLDRSLVAGVSLKDVMLSHIIMQGILVIFQGAICWLFLYFEYNVIVQGSFYLCFLITILPGIFGATLGLLLGVTFQEEVEVFIFSIFLCPNLFLLGGALWPTEGMTSPVSHFLPTLIVESLRSVIYRGVGINHIFVWPGIAAMLCWILFLLILITIMSKLMGKY